MVRQTKQVILVRKDLKMSSGKMAAQVAHASMSVILELNNFWFKQYAVDEETNTDLVYQPTFPRAEPVSRWLNGSFTKICLSVESELEMQSLHDTAQLRKLPVSWIVDEGRTVFKEPTATCCAIGPWWSDEIDEITGHLRLYR